MILEVLSNLLAGDPVGSFRKRKVGKIQIFDKIIGYEGIKRTFLRRHATWLENFYDLVVAIVVFQLSRNLDQDVSIRFSNSRLTYSIVRDI
jgi:hypothetical protein